MAVLEAGEIAGGTSAHTTAKVTAQHGLLYAGLRKGLGEEKAGQYAKANQSAVGEYAAVMEQLGLRDELKRRGTPAGGVANCGMEGERVWRTLDDMEDGPGYFAVVLAKE